MTNCKNCNEPTDGKYCSNCGHPVQLKRIDGHYILHEIEHLIHFERGILYTVKELLIRPGKTVREFISDNRNRLVKPIIFIIITSLIYTLTISFFDHKHEFINIDIKDTEKAPPIVGFVQWMRNHYGYANIIWGLFVSLWAKILFRKYQFNFFEILILLCFVQGMVMVIYTSFVILIELTQIIKVFLLIQLIAGLAYLIWAIGQFFDEKKVMSYVKALASYVLGFTTFFLTAIGILEFTHLITKWIK
jgi:Protein of unknown function (DUF3667)